MIAQTTIQHRLRKLRAKGVVKKVRKGLYELAPEPADVLAALCDDDCRTIVRNLEGAMTASTVSEACDIPLSTADRKLDMMVNATLIEELTEIRTDGHHTTCYRLGFEEVSITVEEDRTLEVTIGSALAGFAFEILDVWLGLGVLVEGLFVLAGFSLIACSLRVE